MKITVLSVNLDDSRMSLIRIHNCPKAIQTLPQYVDLNCITKYIWQKLKIKSKGFKLSSKKSVANFPLNFLGKLGKSIPQRLVINNK